MSMALVRPVPHTTSRRHEPRKNYSFSSCHSELYHTRST